MFLKTVTVGSFQANSYIVGSEDAKYVAVIDPGAQFSLIQRELEEHSKIPQLILLTHAHPDHYGALNDLKTAYPEAMICMHKNDLGLYENNELRKMLGFETIITPKIDKYIDNEDVLELEGDVKIIVCHTPGHTPGGVCYFTSGIMFTGDTIFNGSVGRTDLPGGSFEMLMNSIQTIINNYPTDIEIYPGHGSSSSLLEEKTVNPYFK